tara:strand:+ start:1349 stop:1750 length:402 start_codon:yes stop_codon:yes gene_type:complete
MTNVFFKNDLIKNLDYIPIKNYILFLSAIPEVFWAEYPVMYYRDNKWDALGFLGERLGRTTLITKNLEFCFKKCNLKITECLDNEDEMYLDIINNKERFIKYLFYLENKINLKQLKDIYTNSNKLTDERNYFK